MPIFEARTRNLKITFSPFTTESMMFIGQATLDSIVARIQNVKDENDSPAAPLKPSYAEEKRKGRYVAMGGPKKFSGRPVRDWTLRGRLIQSLQTKSASQERVTIGPTSVETAKILMARNKWDHMWGISPTNYEVLYAAVRTTLLRVKAFRLERVA